ncbi:hypothetical protein [Haloarcula amylovorans]|uniref:hypothetical protein n=1 Tax=Haloarcula amylovorans TaxID=2562280 RepID=UPI0010762F7C|nr:hypothetical protein [Halomicroarcula amylolytica]
MSESPQTTEQPINQPQSNADDSRTDVDWATLWMEFGFDSPDGVGNEFASETQLVAAIQSTEQSVAGDAKSHIQNAVEKAILVERKTEGGITRGYTFVGGDR